MSEDTVACPDGRDVFRRIAGTVAALLRLVVIVVAGLVLTSIAGVAVYAAPLTLPLLFLVAATSRGTGWRVAATVVAALTFFELAWMVTWLLWRDLLGSFVVGVAAGLAFAFAFWRGSG